MSSFFTGDTHFFHANIILYCHRLKWLGFNDIVINPETQKEEWVSKDIARLRAKQMTADMIRAWNEVVPHDGEVYHVGDICFGDMDALANVLAQLNFKKLYYIWGNHDACMHHLYQHRKHPDYRAVTDRIVWLGDMAEVKAEGQSIVLNHYAMRVWDKSHHGNWHLYGHSHGTLPDDPNARSMDVGVDLNPSYAPFTFKQVADKMQTKIFEPVDHHGNRRILTFPKV
jgi:calcineurin-like phosphoesterase family protein